MQRFLAHRMPQVVVAALLLLAAGPPTAPASVPESRAIGRAGAHKPSLVQARAVLERARAAYRDGRDEDAIALVDESLAALRLLMLRDHPATLRVAAGEVFRSAASLRLSASRRIDRRRDAVPSVGPARTELGRDAEGAADPEESPLADAVLDLGLGVTNLAEPVVLPGDPAFEAAESEEAMLPALPLGLLAGGEFPDPEPLPVTRDEAEAKLLAAPVEPIEPAEMPKVQESPELVAVQLVHNERVAKWIDYYTGRGRPHYERYLVRSGRYVEWMQDILREEGLPEEIVQLVFVESGFKTDAVSRSRAVGPWQFIRGTGRIFDLRMNSHVDDRRDPELSTRAAARYLKHLYALFHDWNLALASYNCGEGRTIRTLAKTGVWDYWALRYKRETMHYIPKYMACLAISRDLKRYGFDDVKLDRPLEFDTIHLPGAFDVRAVAEACGITMDSLRVLNPSLRKTVTVPKHGVSRLRVPEGRGDEIVSAVTGGELDLTQIAVAPAAELHQHRVRRGETLGGIARRYRVPMREIADANHIRVNSMLRVGQVLLVPERDASFASQAPAPSAKGTFTSTKTIRIQRGDTLSGIATRYETDVRTLRALNNLRPRQAIRAGGTLKVPIR